MTVARSGIVFALALTAAIFHAVGGVALAFDESSIGFLASVSGIVPPVVAIVFVLLAFIGAVWLYSANRPRVVQGSLITIVIAAAALPTAWGLVVGSSLGVIGGILGLIWSSVPSTGAPRIPRSREADEDEDIGIPDATETLKVRSGKRYD